MPLMGRQLEGDKVRKTTRKIITVAIMGALFTLLPAGLAMALTFTCNKQPGDLYCYGTDQDDNITGTKQVDYIFAYDGDDIVTGRDGDDAIAGGNDDDTIDGGDGNDAIAGEEGNDIIVGGLGNDGLDGGNGNDAIAGVEGDDYIVGGEGDNVIDGGLGNDVMVGGNGIDQIFDRAKSDTDQVGSAGGNDVVNVRDDDGRDAVDCGAGRDDTVKADRGDNVAKNCENVRVARR